MMKEPILLVGAGGHARACIDVIEQEGRYTVVGLVGLQQEVGSLVLGYPVLGTDDDLPNFLSRLSCALITVGQIKSPELRMKLHVQLEALGFSLPVVVSPLSYVSAHAKVGVGTIVMHGAIVNAGANIGRNCIINSKALLEHDAVVGDFCHIATAAVLNGNVTIGHGSFIGSNACVAQGKRVPDRSLVGMGQLVLSDFKAESNLPPFKSKL
jgi:sugar O-acyltransferase (sialic acid O-acetyltransferase NeuD family)